MRLRKLLKLSELGCEQLNDGGRGMCFGDDSEFVWCVEGVALYMYSLHLRV